LTAIRPYQRACPVKVFTTAALWIAMLHIAIL
jgi:hypothetical protein